MYRVLLTNHSLDQRAGTELFIRDWALYLMRAGYGVMVYSPTLGEVAEELRAAGVPIVDDLFTITEPPDLIHGHHHLETVAAMHRFPGVPAVFWCHGWLPWQESPPRFSRIRSYVAVSKATRERLTICSGIDPDRVSKIYNFVDTSRFQPREEILASPTRALFLSNTVVASSDLNQLKQACESLGIRLDTVGRDNRNPTSAPEKLMLGYDIVFARGRAALEAMSVGAFVIVCDSQGLGTAVTPSNFDLLQESNFGLRLQSRELSFHAVRDEIAKYNSSEIAALKKRVREECSLDVRAREIFNVYQGILDSRPISVLESGADSESHEIARYLSEHSAVCTHLERQNLELIRKTHRFDQLQDHLVRTQRQNDRLSEEKAVLTQELLRLRGIEQEYAGILNSRFIRFIAKPFWLCTAQLRSLFSGRGEARSGTSRTSFRFPPFKIELEGKGPRLACVVLSVCNPPELVDAVRSLANQSEAAEILVVNSGGGNPEDSLRAAGLTVSVITKDEIVSAAVGRNIGIRNTKAPIVSFLASDCVAGKDWVKNRIAAHADGAHMVSSSVLPLSSSIFSWGSWALVFPRRGPNLKAEDAVHYGVSYSRRLFDLLGEFREDLQTGEDTEFNQHAAAFVTPFWCPEVVTYHRDPTNLVHIISDQFNRGMRSARAYRCLYETSGAAFVARRSLSRVGSSIRYALKGAPGEARSSIILSIPGLIPLSFMYSLGALLGSFGGNSRVSDPSSIKIIALVAFRNEAAYLPDLIKNLSNQVDAIIALDDGSTDRSAEIISKAPNLYQLIKKPISSPHKWDERLNRRLLIEAALRHFKEAWAIAIDADERLEMNFRESALHLLRHKSAENAAAYRVRILELWDGFRTYRSDGIWGSKSSARLFKLRSDFQFHEQEFHGHWAPLNSMVNGDFLSSDLLLYHLRMVTPSLREQRRIKYEAIDPACRSQAMGYEYLTDEAGIAISDIPHGREYTPIP